MTQSVVFKIYSFQHKLVSERNPSIYTWFKCVLKPLKVPVALRVAVNVV